MRDLKPVERVRIALNHEEPDRVPMALGGGPYGIVDEFYFRILKTLDLGEPVEKFRTGHTISYMDDRLLECLGTDTRYVWPGQSPSTPLHTQVGEDDFTDGYGQPWVYRDPYYYVGKPLLGEAESIEDIDRLITWPQVDDPRWTTGVRERAQALREGTDYYIIARMVASHGPYMTSGHLRGVEQFFVDMGSDPDFVQALVGKVTHIQVAFLKNYLSACGEFIDMIELPGDDYATNVGMAFSPRMFRTYFKPSLKRLVDTVRNYRPQIKVMVHCDGALQKIIPDLIEIGVDVIHPLEPLPAMDPGKVKAEYGGQLAFLGAVDIVQALPGSRADVIAEAKLQISQLAAGGGYILAPANHVQSDVPVKNLITLFEACREYGRYPFRSDEVSRA